MEKIPAYKRLTVWITDLQRANELELTKWSVKDPEPLKSKAGSIFEKEFYIDPQHFHQAIELLNFYKNSFYTGDKQMIQALVVFRNGKERTYIDAFNSEMNREAYISHFRNLAISECNDKSATVIQLNKTMHDDDYGYYIPDDCERPAYDTWWYYRKRGDS